MPDAIGWKKECHSVLVESKVSRADFLADREKSFRQKPELGIGCERYYLAPRGLIRIEELPAGWGLLEAWGREIERVKPSAKNLRSEGRIPERDESSVGEFAESGSPHRTAKHYRLSQVEEPHGGIQPRQVARRTGCSGRRSQRISAGKRGRLRARMHPTVEQTRWRRGKRPKNYLPAKSAGRYNPAKWNSSRWAKFCSLGEMFNGEWESGGT